MLNFLDKAKEEELDRTMEIIQELNPSAAIFKYVDMRVRSNDEDLLERIFVGEFFNIDDLAAIPQNNHPSHHHQQIASVMVKAPHYSSVAQLERNIGTLLW